MGSHLWRMASARLLQENVRSQGAVVGAIQLAECSMRGNAALYVTWHKMLSQTPWKKEILTHSEQLQHLRVRLELLHLSEKPVYLEGQRRGPKYV